jgi:formate hydrogenlyase transcriptional activator
MFSYTPMQLSAPCSKRNLCPVYSVDRVTAQSIEQALQLVHREIEKRKTEQSRIFAFSSAIASEKDPILLAKVLKVQLKGLFDINEYAILGLNTGKSTCKPVLFDIDASAAKPADVHDLLQREITANHAINHIVSEGCPVFLSLQDWEQLTVPLSFNSRAAGKYLSQLLGVPIQIGQENIAVMIFSHENYNKMRQELSLFKCILSQIAIVVCNIIAHQKINSHLNEIALNKKQLIDNQFQEKENAEINYDYAEMIGKGLSIQQIFRLIQQVASANSTVLILGKTGTGKELVARAIHNNSPRRSKLMVKVNCAALPAHLIESELFGHERGSFTGATEKRLGKFELANGGTLFLDEIGEMPLDLQVKLLRALQEREIERIGGKSPIKLDVRIIAATNRDLEKEAAEGRFRSDLYYRLNIFPIILPELKDRKEDIPLLVSHFIHRLAGKTGRKIKGISKEALQDMLLYDWPGNIRELEHLIERSMLLSDGDMLKQIQLPRPKSVTPVPVVKNEFIIRRMEENEKEYIVDMLQYCQGRVGGSRGAAELMGIPCSTLFSKMKKLGIKKGF